jgi:hypothetical protein
MFSLCLILVPERGGCSIGQRLGDSPLQRLADREQAAGGNPVNPRLVLMRLLIGHADRVGELLCVSASMIRRLRMRRPWRDQPGCGIWSCG